MRKRAQRRHDEYMRTHYPFVVTDSLRARYGYSIADTLVEYWNDEARRLLA